MPDNANILRYTPPPRLKAVGIIVAGVAVIIVAFGLISRVLAARQVENWTKTAAIPTVRVITPNGNLAEHALVLPGQVQAFNSAPIYAQISGYVQKWSVDIGTTVKAGDVLAQIDPRTYQAVLNQAKGQLARDTANLANATVDLGRYKLLTAQNAISNQQLATQQATVDADAGIVETDRASVDAAQINVGYTRIAAPFSGVVTSRAIDIGNFVASGNASATPLFTIADESRLRIYVRVPQDYSAQVKPGMTATFTVPEYSGRTFPATVVATADAVDTTTGTLLVQLQADNSARELKPGDYAQVHFSLPAGRNNVEVPASALMFRDSGMEVATIGNRGRVAIKPISVGHDFGAVVEVAAGLTPADRIINNPPDSLRTGDTVRVANAAVANSKVPNGQTARR